MKLLAFSDFHGLYGLINHFQEVKKKISESEPDLLVFCGDFRNNISIPLLESRLKRLEFPATYFVWGNDDQVKPTAELKNGINLHLKVKLLGDFIITGIGGDELDVQWNIERLGTLVAESELKKIILISHIPPFGCCDFAIDGKHVGSKPLRQFIEHYHPIACLFGHIHEQAQKSMNLGTTRCWNVGHNGLLINL